MYQPPNHNQKGKMTLLEILIKERNFNWPKRVAETAQKLTGMGALYSSGFRLALSELIDNELEERCLLYVNHHTEGSPLLHDFFASEADRLTCAVNNRFGIKIPITERRKIILEKYEEIFFSIQQNNKPKEPIGFRP